MKIDPYYIGFDIDGVVADIAEAFIRLADKRHGIKGIRLSDITEFDVASCLPIDPEIVEEIFDFILKDPIEADLKPMDHAVRVLTELSDRAPLIFVTARPRKKPIEAWLEHVLSRHTFKRVSLTAMGDHDGKPDYLRKLGLKYFVDDRAQTCIDLQTAGFTPLVYNQPWNQGRHHLYTVNSWLSIKKLCS